MRDELKKLLQPLKTGGTARSVQQFIFPCKLVKSGKLSIAHPITKNKNNYKNKTKKKFSGLKKSDGQFTPRWLNLPTHTDQLSPDLGQVELQEYFAFLQFHLIGDNCKQS